MLPFIGWRSIYVDNDGYPSEALSHWKADAFEIEWFGFGMVLFIGKIYPA